MEFALALVPILAGILMILIVGVRKRWLIAPLIVAFVARVLLSLIHRYVYPLPQGGADALVFNRTAHQWSAGGCLTSLEYFDPAGSYVYSSLLGVFYGCVGYSPLAGQMINAVMGTTAVAMLALATARVWGVRPAVRLGYFLAIFPALIIYSSVTLRESAILLAVSTMVYCVTRFSERREVKWALAAMAAIGCATLFHGGMALAVVGLLVGLLFMPSVGSVKHSQAAIGTLLVRSVLAIAVMAGAVFYMDSIYLPKIGSVGELDTELISNVVESRAQGDAAYLTALRVSSPVDVVWQAPVRLLYLLYAPFPWNVTNPTHLFGMFDGLIYAYLSLRAWQNRKVILSHTGMRIIFFVLIALALVYAFGTSNFGTAMRHRAKFAVAIAVLVAPFLVRAKAQARGEARLL